MNIHPNEALAYAQSSQGVEFIFGKFIDRFGDRDMEVKYSKIRATERNMANQYVYKVPPHINLEVGDVVIVQVLEGHFGLLLVTSIDDEPPATDEWDYSKPMKWVVGVVPVEYSKDLTMKDRDSLKAISKATLKSRVNEINQSLGFDISAVVPRIESGWPASSDSSEVYEDDPDAVIDEEDDGSSPVIPSKGDVLVMDKHGDWDEE